MSTSQTSMFHPSASTQGKNQTGDHAAEKKCTWKIDGSKLCGDPESFHALPTLLRVEEAIREQKRSRRFLNADLTASSALTAESRRAQCVVGRMAPSNCVVGHSMSTDCSKLTPLHAASRLTSAQTISPTMLGGRNPSQRPRAGRPRSPTADSSNRAT